MEVDEEQLSLFGESVLQLHDKIYQLLGLMNQQVEENTKLVKIVEKNSQDIQYLMNEKFNSESKIIKFSKELIIWKMIRI